MLFRSRPVNLLAKLVLVSSRSVNSLVWALLFVGIFGPGALAGTLAIAFRQRQAPQPVVRSRFDYLVVEGVLTASQLQMAATLARRKGQELSGLFGEVDENGARFENRCR